MADINSAVQQHIVDKTFHGSAIYGGKLKIAQAIFSADAPYSNAPQTNGDVLRLWQVQSSWVPIEITVTNTAIATAAGDEMGLYLPNGGAAVDIDGIFGPSIGLVGAQTNVQLLPDITVTTTRDLVGGAFWRYDIAGGLTEDPAITYDLAVTMATIGTWAAGDFAYFRMLYSDEGEGPNA